MCSNRSVFHWKFTLREWESNGVCGSKCGHLHLLTSYYTTMPIYIHIFIIWHQYIFVPRGQGYSFGLTFMWESRSWTLNIFTQADGFACAWMKTNIKVIDGPTLNLDTFQSPNFDFLECCAEDVMDAHHMWFQSSYWQCECK